MEKRVFDRKVAQDMKKLIIGNWKMHGLKSWWDKIETLSWEVQNFSDYVDIIICPPATLISYFSSQTERQRLHWGGQNCHTHLSGAFTGNISAEMLKDAGADFVILGHSECRNLQGETDEMIAQKICSAVLAGLNVIFCIGETLAEREQGQTMNVLVSQIRKGLTSFSRLQKDLEQSPPRLILAYEPVWAIGTGKIPTLEEIKTLHAEIRQTLSELFDQKTAAGIPILYGGSMKAQNASGILNIPNVNGGLIGGASLDIPEFLSIIKQADEIEKRG